MNLFRRPMLLSLTAGFLCLAAPGIAHAYRPFDGTDADVAGLHEVEIEAGPVGYLQRGRRHHLTLPNLVLNYGVVERWELVLEGTHERALGDSLGEPRSSLVDPEFSAKSVLRKGSLQDAGGISIATELSALLPSTVPDERKLGAEVAFIFSQKWSLATLHLNVAGQLTRAHEYALVSSLIAEGSSSWTLRPVAELLAEHELVKGSFRETTVLSGLGGAILTVSDDLTFDAAMRVARDTDATRVYEGRAGFTWTFVP